MAIVDILHMSDTDVSPVMQVGSVVIPADFNDNDSLAIPYLYKEYARKEFGFAIVISMTPFILASETSRMRWSNAVATKFKAVGTCNPDVLAVAMTRLNS